MSNQATLKPMPLWKAALLFLATSTLIYIAVYFFIPRLTAKGLSFLQAYLICFYTPFALILATALAALRIEKGTFSWSVLADRYRLKNIDKKTWIWIAGLTVFSLSAYLALSFTGRLLASVSWLSPPAFFPAELNPHKSMVSGIFMDTPLKGQWWIIPAYAGGWFLNVFGEELLWRGYLLPRQEALYGKYAWVLHGTLWTLWHVFWKWNLIVILPMAFAIPFVVQRTKNTWVGIIAHGIANLIPLGVIVVGVLGQVISDVFARTIVGRRGSPVGRCLFTAGPLSNVLLLSILLIPLNFFKIDFNANRVVWSAFSFLCYLQVAGIHFRSFENLTN